MSYINWKQYDMDVVCCPNHSFQDLFKCVLEHWSESRGMNEGNWSEVEELDNLICNRKWKEACDFINKHKGLDDFVSVFEYIEEENNKSKSSPQKVLIDEMLRISDGYLKYEFEDFFAILRQALINKVLEGEVVGIDGIVVFKPRQYNSKPRVSNLTGDFISEGSTTTVKAEITRMFKNRLKQQQKANNEKGKTQDQDKET